jgi:hypothetical protein
MTELKMRSLFAALTLASALTPAIFAEEMSILLLPPGQSTEVTVVASTSTFRLSRPRINDVGEIVWSQRQTIGAETIYSNLRAPIVTNEISHEPDINNLGEIIWRFGNGGQNPNGIRSSVRGTVLQSIGIDPYYDTQRINNNGEIIAGRSGNPERVWSSTRGNFANSADSFVRETEVNDLGEVVYEGNNRVYSTVRGAISATPFFGQNPDINNLGEIVWQQSLTLSSSSVWEVWSNVRGKLGEGEFPAINDLGEVVWQRREGNSFNIYSNIRGQITSNPDWNRYPQINNSGAITWLREVVAPIPEPSTSLLIGIAVGNLTLGRSVGQMRRDRKNGQTDKGLGHNRCLSSK